MGLITFTLARVPDEHTVVYSYIFSLSVTVSLIVPSIMRYHLPKVYAGMVVQLALDNVLLLM